MPNAREMMNVVYPAWREAEDAFHAALKARDIRAVAETRRAFHACGEVWHGLSRAWRESQAALRKEGKECLSAQ